MRKLRNIKLPVFWVLSKNSSSIFKSNFVIRIFVQNFALILLVWDWIKNFAMKTDKTLTSWIFNTQLMKHKRAHNFLFIEQYASHYRFKWLHFHDYRFFHFFIWKILIENLCNTTHITSNRHNRIGIKF